MAKRSLGLVAVEHQRAAEKYARSAEYDRRIAAVSGSSCKLRFDAIHGAINGIARAYAHRDSGTTTVEDNLRFQKVETKLKAIDKRIMQTAEAFRRECVLDMPAPSQHVGPSKRRR